MNQLWKLRLCVTVTVSTFTKFSQKCTDIHKNVLTFTLIESRNFRCIFDRQKLAIFGKNSNISKVETFKNVPECTGISKNSGTFFTSVESFGTFGFVFDLLFPSKVRKIFEIFLTVKHFDFRLSTFAKFWKFSANAQP